MTFLGLDLEGWASFSTILGVFVGALALVYSAIVLRHRDEDLPPETVALAEPAAT